MKRKREGYLIVLIPMLVLSVALCMVGCDQPQMSSTKKESMATEASMREAFSQIGMPAIKNYQEKKLAKMIFELRDQENLITYAYVVNLQGELVFIGKCVGFGLPYSVQYTSPEKAVYKSMDSGVSTMPQADPNGLYMPQGLSATWLMMIDPKTDKARPVYVEPQIIVSPFPLH